MYLSLPLPSGRTAKISLEQCLDAFVKDEVLEKSEAWNCPNCKTLRKAIKKLSLSRLPPVLMIHLKRFSFKGPFTDKLDTLVDFPIKGLDLTNYLPPPLPPSADRTRSSAMSADDPRTPLPPYKYDLYGVTNHFGSLSSGHCEWHIRVGVRTSVLNIVFFFLRYRIYILSWRMAVL
jgi:ubiquitin carboxyl-terminal hydrolase 8